MTGLVVAIAATTSLSACSSTSTSDPLPPSPELATMMELRQTNLDDLAAKYDIGEQPEIPLIRFVTANEWPAAQVDCLQEQGYPVKLSSDGEGLDLSGIPAKQNTKGSPLFVALYTCEAQYSMDPRDSQPLDDAQLSALYDYYTTVQVPCLSEHGIEVSPAPSRQLFIETYFSPDGWLPYSSVDITTIKDEDWATLNRECPQSPDVNSLYSQ